MAARNKLLEAPPYPVEQSIGQLGAHLRMARLRRNLTIQEVADRIGTGRRAVADAEKGKPSSGIAVYFALLWAYDLLDPTADLADPARDEVGLAMMPGRKRARPRTKGGDLDSDF